LVFLNAANDLEPFSGLNMNQMEAVGSSDDVNIVVQIKKFANRYDPDFADWRDTSTRLFYVQKDNNRNRITSPILYQKDDVDMGRAQTLREFVDWGTQNFPAERYCLVLWNHGSGWRSQRAAGASIRRGVSYDDQTNSHINTIELPGAIALPGRKWDLLAFDSSLMQMVEVAYEVKDVAAYIAGSEESPPGEGYPYDDFLGRLVANPGMDARTFGTHIVRDTIADYGLNSDITHSLLDASRVGGIAPAVNNLGEALLAAKAQYGSLIAAARADTETYGSSSAYQNYDLVHFAQLLTGSAPQSSTPVPDARVQTAANAVKEAVASAVLVNVNGRQHPNSNGLAIYLPTPAQYRRDDQDQADGVGSFFGNRYSDLAFSRAAPSWQTFLVQGSN
jgi:hypothetical protein